MTASDLGRKLVDHDGISRPEATNQRRQKMEAILAGERAFAHKLQLVALAAWATTMLIPLAGIIGVLTPARDNSSGMYIAFMFLGLVGVLAFVLAILTTAAWLFRSRTSTMTAIEMRLASLEDLIERSGRSRQER